MPMNSPVAKSSSTNVDSAPMSPSTPTRKNIVIATTPYGQSDMSSDDSDDDDDDDEGDPLVYRFRVANPDTPSDSTQGNIKCSTPSTTESQSSLTIEIPTAAKQPPPSSTQAPQHSTTSPVQQIETIASSPVQSHETKALPDIPSSDTLAQLKRRQSKTLGNEESATMNTNHHQQQASPTQIYTISEVVEYQPHHLRASIMEPLSMAINHQHQQEATPTTPTPSVTVEPPKLIIPPAPSHPPPLPPAKDKGRSSIMTIPPSNDNESAMEETQMTDDLDQPTRTSTSNGADYNENRSGNANYSPPTPSPVTTKTSSPPRTTTSTTYNKTGATQTSAASHHISKYHHASYSLTNNPDAIKLYREMAEKTQDDMTQLTYAKYLLEVAELYQPVMMVPSLAGGGDPDNKNNDMKKQLDTEMRKKTALEQEGIRWIRRLSKKGVGEAAFLEATWMETEQYGYKTRHANRIERLYQVAIQAGVPEASYRLAIRKEATNTPPYDVFRLYQKAADLLCVSAIYKMAKIYLHGQLDQGQDFKKGMKYLLSAVEHASITCNEPPYALALILSNKYTKVSIPSELIQFYGGVAKVRKYMEMAAKLGNIGAKNRLGHLYEHGSYGPMDIAQAFMYYEEAAKQGHHLQSMLGLSRLYNVGCHGPNDHDEQYRMENDTSGWLASHSRDEDQSFYWCHRAAKGGLPDALYLLGWYYEIGFGAPRNDQLSVECYQQASRKGQLDAKDRLAARN